jgi:hypothetical protein
MTEPPRYGFDPPAGLLKLELVFLRSDPLFVSYGYRATPLFTYALTKGEFLNDYETVPYLARFLSGFCAFLADTEPQSVQRSRRELASN